MQFRIRVTLSTVALASCSGTSCAGQDVLTAQPDLAVRDLTTLFQAHRAIYHNRVATVCRAATTTAPPLVQLVGSRSHARARGTLSPVTL